MEDLTNESEALQEEKFVIFNLTEKLFAFPQSTIIEIVEVPQLIRFPGLPDVCRGISNYKKQKIAVIDLNVIIYSEKTRFTVNTCLLICKVKIHLTDCLIGFLVDSLNEVCRIDPEGEEKIFEDDSDFAFSNEFFYYRGERVNILNYDTILPAEELSALSEKIIKNSL